jgi:phosphinothricin acetyltransferase
MRIRLAAKADAERLAAIYAHHVRHGLGTFEETPPAPAEMARRLAAIQAQDLPWLVAEDEPKRILGYAYAGPFRARAA